MRRVAALAIAVLALLWAQRLGSPEAAPSSATALALGFTLLGASIVGDLLRPTCSGACSSRASPATCCLDL
jgi:hypothetical protein